MTEGSSLNLKMAEDLKQAMRSGDTVRRDTLRMLVSSVKYAEMAKQAPLTDSDILGVIAREVKRRQESIDAYRAASRPDLAAKEEAEMAILQSYLPRQAAREEIANAARKVIAEVGAVGLKDKGKVMQRLIPMFKGAADGKVISDIVTELLQK